VDILYLVDRLENLIASSRRMPLFNQIMVKESEILNVIDQMRTAIPDEIKQARRVLQEKERILAQAQADASTLLARAREESEKAMNREGLLRAAEERSKEMVRLAEENAEQLKIEADGYVAETLHALHDHLSSIETEIARQILSIEKGLASLDTEPEAGAYGEEDGEEDMYTEEGDDQQSDSPGPRAVPRRASLAVDTMGGPMHSQDSPPRT
jgi:hypothetical protein